MAQSASTMNGVPMKRKKNLMTFKLPTTPSMRGCKPALGKQQIEDIFPVAIDPTQLTPQVKQYILDMEKEYLDLKSTLMNNRAKYEEMFAGLAALLDEQGVSSDELIQLFNKSIYYPPQTD